ncbi:MAG TPA: SemiSWEET family transporter [Nitrosopumilaceae archaeon]|nr:SemiSWEET family transporter [Nitrosopumilaceae archaeon]
MEAITMVGLSAGVIAILGYLPQIFKSFTLKKMDEVSVWLMILFMTSSLLWTIYGFYKQDIILSGLSSVTFSLATTLIVMKMIFEKRFSNNFILRSAHIIR